MTEERRKHPRNPSNGKLTIQTSLARAAYSVPLQDISKGGAFIATSNLPAKKEQIRFEILDTYGLIMIAGSAQVVRVVEAPIESGTGFAIQFDNELDQAMLDYLSAVHMEEVF
jgi:PilZ domain-containing protein